MTRNVQDMNGKVLYTLCGLRPVASANVFRTLTSMGEGDGSVAVLGGDGNVQHGGVRLSDYSDMECGVGYDSDS